MLTQEPLRNLLHWQCMDSTETLWFRTRSPSNHLKLGGVCRSMIALHILVLQYHHLILQYHHYSLGPSPHQHIMLIRPPLPHSKSHGGVACSCAVMGQSTAAISVGSRQGFITTGYKACCCERKLHVHGHKMKMIAPLLWSLCRWWSLTRTG